MAYNKNELIQKIQSIETLSNEEKAALIELLRSHKKYGLVWEDKPEVVEDRLRAELPVLSEVKEKAVISKDSTAPNHLLIEGDNLEALVALSYTHEGKVDIIYIDPPYNTGNKDFTYNDRYVAKEDSYCHSLWISFMSRRLRIAKHLMSYDGVIFISIDDNEIANLTLLCNEIFGENNRICTICRQAIKGGSRASNIKTVHDYVLVYAKNFEAIKEFTGIEKAELKLDCEDEKGPYVRGRELNKWGAGSRREDSPTMWFPIPGPNGEDVYPIRNDGSDGRWRWGKKKLLDAVAANDVIFEKRDNGSYIVYEKVRGLKSSTIQYTSWFADNYINAKGSEAIKRIFNTLMSVFDYAKPVELIHDLIFMVGKKDATVLDFFAGSGTTLHATMQLNSEDEGCRRCIIVTNNENNICEEITYIRNKKVIEGYTSPKGEVVDGLSNNSLRYYKTAFVARERSPKNMRALMAASTELLCIKNDIYVEQESLAGHKLPRKFGRYFDDGRKRMLIIFNEETIPEFAQLISSMDYYGKMLVYVFSPNNYPFEDEFVDVLDKVELCALPAAIYNAYLKVLPKKKKAILPEAEEETIEPGEIEDNGMLNFGEE